jgi:hypothetical protein
MKKSTIFLTLVAGLALNSAAFAGFTGKNPVTITGSVASGGVDYARHSSDNKQRISCYTLGTPSGSLIGCTATDKNNNSLNCYYPNPSIEALTVVASLNEASDIVFAADSSGLCSYLLIQNSSADLH